MKYRLFYAEGTASKGIRIILEEVETGELIPATTDREATQRSI